MLTLVQCLMSPQQARKLRYDACKEVFTKQTPLNKCFIKSSINLAVVLYLNLIVLFYDKFAFVLVQNFLFKSFLQCRFTM